MSLFDNVTRKTRGNSRGESKMHTERTETVLALAKAAKQEPLPEAIAKSLGVKANTKAQAFILFPEHLDFTKDDGEVSQVKYDACRQYAARFAKEAGWTICEGKMLTTGRDDEHAGVLLVKKPNK